MAKTINLNGEHFDFTEVSNELRIALDSRLSQPDMLEAFAELGRLEAQDKFYPDDPALNRIGRDIDDIEAELNAELDKPRAERDLELIRKLEAEYNNNIQEYSDNRELYAERNERAKTHQAKKLVALMSMFRKFLDLLWFVKNVVDVDQIKDALSADKQVDAWLKAKDEDKDFQAWCAGVDMEELGVIQELVMQMGKSSSTARNRKARRKATSKKTSTSAAA